MVATFTLRRRAVAGAVSLASLSALMEDGCYTFEFNQFLVLPQENDWPRIETTAQTNHWSGQ
jgi:hypothetical protein